MRGPTRSASVMAATTSGWLMVWPKAIGSAVLSQARSAKVGDTKRSRSTAAMARQHVLVGDARVAQLGDQALHGRDVHGRPPQSALARPPRTARRACGACASWVRSRCSGVTEMWPERTAAMSLSSSISLSLRLVADPVVGAAARVDALDDVAAEAARALVRHPHALDRAGDDVGEVDVDQHVARPVLGQHAARPRRRHDAWPCPTSPDGMRCRPG